MFKRKKKENLIEDEALQEQEEQPEEYELQERYDKLLAKSKRKAMIQKFCLFLCLALGVIGCLRSCATIPNTAANELEAQSFVVSYAKNYFAYPTEQTNEYLQNYTLQKNWTIKYGEGVTGASLKDVDIYKLAKEKTEEEEKEITKYYCSGNLVIQTEANKTEEHLIYFMITVAKENNEYLVIAPVENVEESISAITDEERLKSYVFEPEMPTQVLNDAAKEELNNTLSLFMKTYNDDIVQARLLCSSEEVIDKLDPNMKLTLKNISSAAEDEEKLYAIVDVEETYGNLYSATKKYYFVIGKEKNKIEVMEVY